MGKNFEKSTRPCLVSGYCTFLIILFCHAGSVGFAGQGIRIISEKGAKTCFVETQKMKNHGTRITAIDPNFEDDGPASFTGISLKKLMKIACLVPGNGITIIGADHYVGYLSQEHLDEDLGLLCWQMDGKSLPRFKGGPLKMMFPKEANVHGSCYTWYVDTIVSGSIDNALLTVSINRTEVQYSRKDLLPHAVPLDPEMFSIPQGCRNKFETSLFNEKVYAVPLDYFINPGTKTIEKIECLPFAGKKITLDPRVIDYPIYIIVGYAEHSLHPALGGPFSIIFPVEQHSGLAGLVPESGAMFFLSKIIVN